MERIRNKETVSGGRSELSNPLLVAAVDAVIAIILLVILLRLTWYSWGLTLAILSLSYVARARRVSKYSAVALGALVPIAPILGHGSVLALGIAYAWPWLRSKRRSELRWSCPLLALTGFWTLTHILFHTDWEGLSYLATSGGGALGEYFATATPDSFLALYNFARIALICILIQMWSASSSERKGFLLGLFGGLAGAWFLTVFQVFDWYGVQSVNQSSYWTSIDRWTGSFSDPNAFGVFIALSLPLLFLVKARESSIFLRVLTSLFCIFWCWLALYSGSRSFFLGLGVFAAWFLYAYKPRVGIVSAVAGVALLLLLQPALPLMASALGDVVPTGLTRILESLELSHLSQTFFSRAVFWKLALLGWMSHPLTGLGFGWFRVEVPRLSYSAGIDIGTWSDNANNFYLGVLSDLGCLGALALVWAIMHFRFVVSSDESWLEFVIRRGVFVTLLLLLVVGPHIEFDEVAILSALIVTLVARPNKKVQFLADITLPLTGPESRFWKYAFSSVIGVIIVISSYGSEQGVYAWEKGERGRFFRWTGTDATVSLPCLPKKTDPVLVGPFEEQSYSASLRIRALHPDLDNNPLRVRVINEVELPQELLFSNAEERLVSVSCDQRTETRVELEVDRVWVPKEHGSGTDPRPLGVQVIAQPHWRSLANRSAVQ